jgi:uncharacterized membrane protein
MKQHPVCAITGKTLSPTAGVYVSTLRPPVLDILRQEHPDIAEDAVIDRREADRYRALYMEQLLEQERGALGDLEKRVLSSFANRDTISENVDADAAARRSFGERAADAIAAFGGSWVFILSFLALLALWMAYNVAGRGAAFDPYPFILLNLVLSCLAALQAPIIMMSQRRQEAKDRSRAENDYRVNLKAELEIRALHDKVDHIITRQWRRLAEIQALQLDLLRDISERPGG